LRLDITLAEVGNFRVEMEQKIQESRLIDIIVDFYKKTGIKVECIDTDWIYAAYLREHPEGYDWRLAGVKAQCEKVEV
jgi:hypothetical protein